MSLQKLMVAGAILVTASGLPACNYADESEPVAEAEEAIGPDGNNNVSPEAIDAAPLRRSITNSFSLTSPTTADPLQLCQTNTITSTGCTMKQEWEAWLNADVTPRSWMMKGIAKCAVDPSFAIQTSDGSKSFPGQWTLFPEWKSNRLAGQAKRERMSSCILSLINGNNETLTICIMGPGTPFDAPCSDPMITNREGGFFGDLFADNPTAYVAGPDSNNIIDNGRVCHATQGTYCCAEDDTSCTHRIVLAGAIMGAPDQDFANKRCTQLAANGGFEFCTSFFSTREPGRVYSNVFTTFVPPAQ